MDLIFEKLGFGLEGGQPLHLMVINNPDGTPRWIFRANTTSAIFLKLYSAETKKAKLMAMALRVLFFLRLQPFFFKKTTLKLTSSNSTGLDWDLWSDDWAIFTGTPGPNNKIVVYRANTKGASFFKIATTPNASVIIAKEKRNLEELVRLSPQKFIVPTPRANGPTWVELSDVSSDGARANELQASHWSFLGEMAHSTRSWAAFSKLDTSLRLSVILSELRGNIDLRLPQGMLAKLKLAIQAFDEEDLNCSMAHADFTPWNCYVLPQERLAVYDWELAVAQLPKGFDAFHFTIQKGVLVDRKPWSQIRAEIMETMPKEVFEDWFQSDITTMNKYLLAYLTINATHHLKLYTGQGKWHVQVNWLLQVWNDALSDLLSQRESPRKLLVMDFFDRIMPLDYAAMKFPEARPETLGEYSDIDICIGSKDAHEVMEYLKRHSLVKKHHVNPRSNMLSAYFVLKDDSLLSIDFIWQLKRKSLQMLDLDEVLANARLNAFGVKKMDNQNEARYVGLFYGLNKSEVPERYRSMGVSLSPHKNELDARLSEYFKGIELSPNCLEKQLAAQPSNQGFPKIKNQIRYFMDVIRESLNNKGLVVTFSGVDGAGKSTIIENVKNELEKKLRKRVVVIRHRPSVLPILSVWTKGSQKAQSDVVASLPRQGQNKSKLSSLLRFSYYYTDYLFGQFYVWMRYTSRGYVVLYDRYYFDFINDGKRSNIELPKSLTKFGYRFLMKPDLNFFLYADAQTILARKKELDSATIESLTKEYKSLFEELSHSKNAYFCIENIELKQTLDFIIRKCAGCLG